MSRVLYLVTNFHHFGCNILGLSLTLVWVAMALVGQQSVDRGMPGVAIACSILGIAGVVIIDLLWRYLAEPRYSPWRFLLPGSGGSFVFVPIWLQFPAFLLIGTVIVTVKAITGQ